MYEWTKVGPRLGSDAAGNGVTLGTVVTRGSADGEPGREGDRTGVGVGPVFTATGAAARRFIAM
jgi:hypothetical protein